MEGGLESVIFFTKNPYLKQNFFLGGGDRWGGDGNEARVSKIYFTKNPNKKKEIFVLGGGGEGWGVGWGARVSEFFLQRIQIKKVLLLLLLYCCFTSTVNI